MVNFFKKYTHYFLIAFLAVGFYSLLGRDVFPSKNVNNVHPVREKDSNFTFINPLLFYDGPSDPKKYSGLLEQLEKIINGRKDSDNSKISVYYRDLVVGQWVGISQDDEYSPASMLKVVVMIASLKHAEKNPEFLSTKIKFSQNIKNLIGSIPYDRGTELELDKSYTVQELIEKMIIRSDNGAMYALIYFMDEDILSGIYSDLGLNDPVEKGRNYTISAKNYASFFRLLYNATYINREMSEKALSILTRSDFKEGLFAGVPEKTVVAHKYGESVITAEDDKIKAVELHDCGIIYHPQRPYILCVMTKGDNIKELIQAIKEISQVTYVYTSNILK